MLKKICPIFLIFALLIPLVSVAYAAELEDSDEYAAVLSGHIGLYSDGGCTREVTALPGTNTVAPGKVYYIRERSSGTVYGGYSCYIYANAVYNTLFGDVPHHGSSSSWQASKCVASAKSSVSYAEFTAWGVLPGSLMRTTGNSNGTYNGDKGHSVIILGYDENNVRYLEGNGDGNGLIRTVERSWSDFNWVLLTHRGYKVAFIVSPTESLNTDSSTDYDCEETSDIGFSDVSSAAWYYDSVKKAVELGLMDGQGGGIFSPVGNVTNAEAAVLAARLLSFYCDDEWDFTPAEGEAWYEPYSNYLEICGITPPSDDSWSEITRGDFACLINDAVPEGELSDSADVSFADVPCTADCYTAVTTLAGAGILRGSDGLFSPDSAVTRAEAAAILVRVADENERAAVDT